jgi:general secretion pathway protein A
MSKATGLPVGLMYEQIYGHFGLTRNPFLVSPDPENFYSTAAHDEALLQLVSRIEARQGFLALTGEAGTGKTIVLRYLLDWLRRYNYPTAYVFHPLLRSADLLELILEDFGVPCHSNSKKDLLVALKNWLIDRHKVGDCPVILIDEAQALKNKTLHQLAALLRLQVNGARLVQLVLAGQPSLEEKLNERQLKLLQLRVMCHCRLPALSMTETAGYISSRLSVAGASGIDSAMFPGESVEEIFGYSRGIPRVINLLCEHAFLAAYADRRKVISPNDVLRVAQFFDLSGAPKLDKDAVASGTFCRLIPFPHLETAVAEVQPIESQLVSVHAHEIIASCAQAEPVVDGPMALISVVEKGPMETDQAAVGTLVEIIEEPVPVAMEEARIEAPILLPECAASLATVELPVHDEQEVFALEPEPVKAVEEPEPALPLPELEPIFEFSSAKSVVPLVPLTESIVTVFPLEPDLPAIEPEPVVLAASVEETMVLALQPQVEAVDLPVVEEPVAEGMEEGEKAEEPVAVAAVSLPVAEPVQGIVLPEVAPTATDAAVLLVIPEPIVVELPLAKPLVKTPVLARVVAFPPPPRVVLVKPRISPPRLAASRQRIELINLNRGKMRFVQYWRGVRHSLVRDGRAFGQQCSIWLQKPMEKGWISESTYKTFVSVSSWLQQPLHSGPVGRSHPQLPSASHKHP